MPSSTFRYTGGNTIRAEISKDRFSDEKKISARMMKDTTGTAFTTATRGLNRSRIHWKRAASGASTAASAQARRKPPRMRREEKATACQKAAVPARASSRPSACTGEASSSIRPPVVAARARLAPSHTSSQKAAAHSRTEPVRRFICLPLSPGNHRVPGRGKFVSRYAP